MENVKDLLKVGYLCETRDKRLWIVLPEINKNNETEYFLKSIKSKSQYVLGVLELTFFRDDLTRSGINKDLDIMKIYGFSNCVDSFLLPDIKYKNLIWERKRELKVGDKVRVKNVDKSCLIDLNNAKICSNEKDRYCRINKVRFFNLYNNATGKISTIQKPVNGQTVVTINFDSEQLEFIDKLFYYMLFDLDDLELIE